MPSIDDDRPESRAELLERVSRRAHALRIRRRARAALATSAVLLVAGSTSVFALGRTTDRVHVVSNGPRETTTSTSTLPTSSTATSATGSHRGGGTPTTANPEPQCTFRDVDMRVEPSRQTYQAHEKVHITTTLKNTSRHTCYVRHDVSAVQMTDAPETFRQTIIAYPVGPTCYVPCGQPIEPGHAMVSDWTWDQRRGSADGSISFVAPGRYRAEVVFDVSPWGSPDQRTASIDSITRSADFEITQPATTTTRLMTIP